MISWQCTWTHPKCVSSSFFADVSQRHANTLIKTSCRHAHAWVTQKGVREMSGNLTLAAVPTRKALFHLLLTRLSCVASMVLASSLMFLGRSLPGSQRTLRRGSSSEWALQASPLFPLPIAHHRIHGFLLPLQRTIDLGMHTGVDQVNRSTAERKFGCAPVGEWPVHFGGLSFERGKNARSCS